MEALLRMERISKRFGSVWANKQVEFDVQKGEIHTLLGENGAGKSTLMNILFGLYQPTEGSIYLRGKAVKIDSAAQAVKLGVGMVHQHFMLVEAMTVFENIILGDKRKKGLFIDKATCLKEIMALSEQYGLDITPNSLVTELSLGEQQRVEIIKALYRGVDLLVLDEPTAALTDIEVEGLYAIMEKLKQEGKSIVFISHKMREVLHVSDRITILRAGETVCTVQKEETSAENLADLMIGKKLAQSNYEKVETAGETVLSLNEVSYNKASKHNGLNRVSVELGKGEILGIAGVDGNGQSQLAQLVSGVISPEEGQVELKQHRIEKFDVQKFIDEHVSHIPEDRNKMGLVGDMSVQENLLLKKSNSSTFSVLHGIFLKKKEIRTYSEEMRKQYDIRCAGITQEARSLSGGNQQKVILARELESEPDLLIAVHPTRGLDIGATRFIHDTIIACRDKGCAVLLISADFDEILELADRIAVMYEGQVMGVYSGINPPVEEISRAMAGKKKEAEHG